MMLHVVDTSVLLAVARGDVDVLHRFSLMRKREVAVPEPVILHVSLAVRGLTQYEAFERWRDLLEHLPRLAWTEEVTEAIIDLEPPEGMPVDLDTLTAAHATARRAALYTREPERYSWIRRLRLEVI